MSKYNKCCRGIMWISFSIIFGIFLKMIIIDDHFINKSGDFNTTIVRRNFGIPSSVDTCREIRQLFPSSIIQENMSFDGPLAGCIFKDATRKGVVSYLTEKNFAGTVCQQRKIGFSESDMPQVALASYPGSGNTWFRHLLEQVSGIATGSLYCGVVTTFIGECKKDTSKTIVIKTHNLATKTTVAKFEKAVLIIRSPFDVILAEYNRFKTKMNKTGVANREDFRSADRERATQKHPIEWRQHVISWITQYTGPLHIIFYENMKSNLYEELYKLSKFLRITVTFKDLWCTGVNQKGSYKRIRPEWQNPSVLFTPKMKEYIRQSIRQVSYSFTTKYSHEKTIFDVLYSN